MRYVIVLLALWAVCLAAKKKKKSEYTQKDWDRIAREWEREELEEEEREEKANRKPLKFDPNGNMDSIISQAKRGKPTMIFFTLKEKHCPTMKHLEQVSQRYANMLLSGHVPVSNYPVGERRAIFMTKEGSQTMEIKNFLLKQEEVDHVSIDNRVYTPSNGPDQPLAPEDPVMRKILGQAPLSDKEMAKIKAKKAREEAEELAREKLNPGGDLPTAPEFPHDPTTGQIDLKKFEAMGGHIMTEEEAANDDRTDEEFRKDSGLAGMEQNQAVHDHMAATNVEDDLPDEMMKEDEGLDKDDDIANEDIAEPEKVEPGHDQTLAELNANDQSLHDQAMDFVKNSGLGKDDPLIQQLVDNRPNIKKMVVTKEKSANDIPSHTEDIPNHTEL